MGVVYSNGFEGYADGSSDMVADGWHLDLPTDEFEVVSDFFHSGVKSVRLGAQISFQGQMQRRGLGLGPSVSASGWFFRATEAVGGDDEAGTSIFPGGIGLFTNSSSSAGLFCYLVLASPTQIRVQNDAGEILATSAAGVVDPGAGWFHLRLDAYLSSVAGGSVASDGCVKVYANGVLVLDLSGQRVFTSVTDIASNINIADGVSWQIEGWCDDVEITDDVVSCLSAPSEIPPPNDSTPCCGSGPGPGNPDPTSTPNPGNPPIPLQPWTPMCDGGGTVPFAADVTDAESWAL